MLKRLKESSRGTKKRPSIINPHNLLNFYTSYGNKVLKHGDLVKVAFITMFIFGYIRVLIPNTLESLTVVLKTLENCTCLFSM